jgi:hypothetical protein
MENVPEKFLDDKGELNTSALVKSYCELEKKMSNMISVPNDDSDESAKQKFNHAIGVPENASEYPTNDLFDDESVRNKFHEIGLTKKQVEQIYSIAEEFLQPTLKNLFELQNQTNAINELKNFFGGTEKMNDALREIKAFGEKYLPASAFEELCATPQGIQGVYKMMQSFEPTVLMDKNVSENLTDDMLRNMMRDPKYWRDQDPEYVRKIENGFKKLYS